LPPEKIAPALQALVAMLSLRLEMARDDRGPQMPGFLDELESLSDHQLMMALSDWLRWRDRLRRSSRINRHPERLQEAVDHVDAIELELSLRTSAGRDRLRQEMAAIKRRRVVRFADYRAARARLDRLAHRFGR
jgi:hypothetical protein